MDDKYYIIDLDTNEIKADLGFNCIWGALEWGNGKLPNFTAMKGAYLKPDERFTINAIT